MSDTVLTRLGEFDAKSPTHRILGAVLTIVPGSSPFGVYQGLPSAVAAMGGGPELVPVATRHLGDEGIGDVLWMSGLVDKGDKTYAVYTGATTAVKLFFGRKRPDRASLLDVDKQQRTDAVLKALALSYMAWKAFPGSVSERVKAFAQSPSGEAMLTWYAAMELGLPFADNALLSGGRLFEELLGGHRVEQLGRLKKLAGGRDLSGIGGVLDSLTGPITGAVDKVLPHLDSVADAAKEHVPGALGLTDKATGIAATAVDMLPVYRLLGARVAAEAAVARGRAG